MANKNTEPVHSEIISEDPIVPLLAKMAIASALHQRWRPPALQPVQLGPTKDQLALACKKPSP